ncbi:MAG: carbonate dehydratase [Burkholderiaceae bacterium]|nr:MAG: carbonate dehydratase [Burkholderiaceae bacterium]
MKNLTHLFNHNRRWARDIEKRQPGFFAALSNQQAPEYLWIGCSDSRVPANEIVGLPPGELFVHRNVANLVVHTDINCLSVMQYAVDVLKVKHIIVCGHYGCGGVRAALENRQHGLIDNWLRNIQEVYRQHQRELQAMPATDAVVDRLCELNVAWQTLNVGHTTVVQEAWARGQEVRVHGWVYGLSDGLLKDLQVSLSSVDELQTLEQKLRGL